METFHLEPNFEQLLIGNLGNLFYRTYFYMKSFFLATNSQKAMVLQGFSGDNLEIRFPLN
jgi:hypothetical protein